VTEVKVSTLHGEQVNCTWFPLTPESPWSQQYEEQAHQNRQLEKELKQLQEELAKQKGDKGSQSLTMWHTKQPSPYISI